MIRRLALNAAAPFFAIAASLVLCGLVLKLSGNDPVYALKEAWAFGWERESVISTMNRALPLFLSALAFTVAFRNNLFHIGVEGEYRVAALCAAWLGAQVNLPAPIHVFFVVAIAMIVGGATAVGIAALKVKRGVHEVISSIMFNAIALSLTAFLAREVMRFKANEFDLSTQTRELPSSAHFPSLNSWLSSVGIHAKSGFDLGGFILPTIVVGLLYWFVINRTTFGYSLRAGGANPRAAQYAGIDTKRMIYVTMATSGALAGLIGMHHLLGESHQFDLTDFPQGLGFVGIAVALLGRGNAGGMAIAALLFGWLDRVGQRLDLVEIPNSVIMIIKGIIPLLVVIAFEVVRRYRHDYEARTVASGLSIGSEASSV